METHNIIIKIEQYANIEITKYGLPSKIHFELSRGIGLKLADIYSGDPLIVEIGVMLMDYKLGEAFMKKQLAQHILMSVDSSKEILSPLMSAKDVSRVLHCVEAHHGNIPYKSIEAEICANADCYRFVHPVGVLSYMNSLGKRNLSFNDFLKQCSDKLEEKWKIISLPYCKEELSLYYSNTIELITSANKYLGN